MIKHSVIFLSFFTLTLFADKNNWYGSTSNKNPLEEQENINPSKKFESLIQYTGGYKQNENISWEASYTDFGSSLETSLENIQKEHSAISYAVGGKFTLLDKNNIKTNFKVGLHRWEEAFDKHKDIGTNLFYGIGMNIPINTMVEINTNYETYPLKDSNIDKLVIGITYKF